MFVVIDKWPGDTYGLGSLHEHVLQPLVRDRFACVVDKGTLDGQITVVRKKAKETRNLGVIGPWSQTLGCLERRRAKAALLECSTRWAWESVGFPKDGIPIRPLSGFPTGLAIGIYSVVGPSYCVLGGPLSGPVHRSVTADKITVTCKLQDHVIWGREFSPSFPASPDSLLQVQRSGWNRVQAFLEKLGPSTMLTVPKEANKSARAGGQ